MIYSCWLISRDRAPSRSTDLFQSGPSSRPVLVCFALREFGASPMKSSNARDPYRVAFEQAQSLLRQLISHLDGLDVRHAALVSATQALEELMSQPATEQELP